ncbi:MAG TPA: hypothetical protein PLK31_12240 [Chloroflexota bacterium]|nr:hypothetical protein [Chloroflexota bacterium]
MNTRQLLAIVCLVISISVGCTAVPDPTHSPQTLAGEGVTVIATRPLLTATPTAILATETAVPILTDLPIPTDTPQPAPTQTLYPTRTALTLPILTWADNLVVLKSVNDWLISWSPVKNELIYKDCPKPTEPPTFPEHFVFLATAPAFQDHDVTPTNFSCYGIVSFYWRPDGKEIFVSGIAGKEIILRDASPDIELWRMDLEGNNITYTNLKGWFLGLKGWLTDEVMLYTTYSGGGSYYLTIHHLSSGDEIATMWAHNPHVQGINSTLVVLEQGSPEYFNSVTILSTEVIHDERGGDLGPNAHSLSHDGTANYLAPDFFSSFSDWLPSSSQVLVETWDAEINLTEADLLHEDVFNLQLWDLESNELSLLVPGAFLGDFSPDGIHLAYIAPDKISPQLQLLNRTTREIIFSSPAFLETDEQGTIFAFHSFSPDGRTLTFYSPTPELMLYDLETGEFLPPFTAVPFTPLWSPDSSRFVYQHPTAGLSIFDRRTNTTYPLATSGGERLANPQWSYDGTYLSVTVQQDDGSRDTAVLQIP